jgi:putative ABC transport system permease protein
VIYGALFNTFPFVDRPPVLKVISHDKKEGGIDIASFSAVEVRDFQEQNRVFDVMAGATSWDDVVLTGAELPERWTGARVTGDFFKLLGVPPLMGRALGPQDVQAGAPPVAVLSHKVWQNSLGGDPKILGRTLTLNGRPTTIIGVMPPRFVWNDGELWLPATFVGGGTAGEPPRFEVYGRLKPGITIEQAEAEIGALGKHFAAPYPKDFPPDLALGVVSLAELLRQSIRPWFVLLGAVSFLLLIACVNVANLLLARASARAKETAVRAALGASRGRLVRQYLMESLLLALAGAALGCLLAWGVLGFLMTRTTEVLQFIPREAQIGMNGPALLFALSAACLSTLLFGLAPALLAAGKDLQQPLQSTGLRTGESRGHRRLRTLLAVTEVALSLTLLTGAGIALRSFWGRYHIKRGFDANRVMFSTIPLPETRYKTLPQKTRFDLELLRRVRALPGVVFAALESPPVPSYFPATIEITGQPQGGARRADVHWTGDSFFETLGIRLLQGRSISPDDMAQSRRVAVVNQKLVTEYFGDESPLGQLITLKEVEGYDATAAPPQGYEVVGVIADSNLGLWPERPVQPEIFLPFTVGAMASVRLYVRTAVPAGIYAKSVRRAVAAIDQDLPVRDTITLEKFIDNLWYARPRFSTLMLISIASLALLLASVGVYGVLSYTVSRRTQEIGIRMALGAEATDVRRMVMTSGLRWLAAGIAAGVPASIALSRFLQFKIWGIGPADPLTLIAVSLLLIVVGLAACYIPARRATQVDPMVALRYE